MTADLPTLTGIFCEVFDNPRIQLTLETTARDVPEWDSLMHIQLIVAVEKKFNVRFAPGEVESLKNVGQFIDLVQRKSAKTGS